jgi:hypothetical protein
MRRAAGEVVELPLRPFCGNEPIRITEKETAPGNARGRFITYRYTTRHRLTLRVLRAAPSTWWLKPLHLAKATS